ncbi:MAG: hypothetical protein H0Z24_08730 [Thermosipho sp. (in: Bacteria)]|nr:hypothetical protein [Thermosipho sp. (in: thermotogales)]
MLVNEKFACCSMWQECKELAECVAHKNPFLKAEEVERYKLLCSLAGKYQRGKVIEISPLSEKNEDVQKVEETVVGQLSLF